MYLYSWVWYKCGGSGRRTMAIGSKTNIRREITRKPARDRIQPGTTSSLFCGRRKIKATNLLSARVLYILRSATTVLQPAVHCTAPLSRTSILANTPQPVLRIKFYITFPSMTPVCTKCYYFGFNKNSNQIYFRLFYVNKK